jgi:hypothetical protein
MISSKYPVSPKTRKRHKMEKNAPYSNGHYVYSCQRFSSGNTLEDYNP